MRDTLPTAERNLRVSRLRTFPCEAVSPTSGILLVCCSFLLTTKLRGLVTWVKPLSQTNLKIFLRLGSNTKPADQSMIHGPRLKIDLQLVGWIVCPVVAESGPTAGSLACYDGYHLALPAHSTEACHPDPVPHVGSV